MLDKDIRQRKRDETAVPVSVSLAFFINLVAKHRLLSLIDSAEETDLKHRIIFKWVCSQLEAY